MRGQQNDQFDIMKCVDWQDAIQAEEKCSQGVKYQKQLKPQPPKKVSFKNKYVNKVKQSCGGISTFVLPLSQVESELSLNAEAEKRLRNKQAARESRERKKKYINIVQKEIRILQDQLQSTNKELQKCKYEIQKANLASQQNVGGSFISQVAQVFKKLGKLINEQESFEFDSQINLAVDSLCYRFALLGRQRVSNINRGYSQILKLGIPQAQRYIMWSASEGSHLFTEQPPAGNKKEDWFAQFKSVIGDLPISQKQKLMNNKEGIAQTRTRVIELVSFLLSKREEMMMLCGQIDELHQDIRNIFSPKQFAKWLIFSQELTYKQELRFFQNICLQDLGMQLGNPNKKVKLDQE